MGNRTLQDHLSITGPCHLKLTSRQLDRDFVIDQAMQAGGYDRSAGSGSTG